MPIVGDRVYGGRTKVPANIDEQLREKLQRFNRQALHATRLTITHPHTDETLSWEVGVPDDMQALIDQLTLD